jgi:coenzyme F420 hydrogenase subunit beta
LDSSRCTGCGLCLRACPGHSVDFKALSLEIFGKAATDIRLGNYQGCYLGHSSDYAVRYNAASGGVITALLLFALEKGLIDGALVTRMRKDRPLEPESFIARTREEIIDASKSKYCPVPANIALKEILASKEGAKFAVVGLPCHIQGIRKAESCNKNLKEKIVLHLGLFCSHTDTFFATEFLLSSLGLNSQDVATINYRGEGWPGSLSILLKNGQKKILPYSKMISAHILWFFAFPRCTLCCDLTAELADISCGDAWLPQLMANDNIGQSIAICRTRLGSSIFTEAIKTGYINSKQVDPLIIKQSINMARTKKKDIRVQFFLRRLLAKPFPAYRTLLLNPNFTSYLRTALLCFNLAISSNKYFRGRLFSYLLHKELSLLGLDKEAGE